MSALSVTPGQSFVIDLAGATPGQTGALGVTIVDTQGNLITPRTTVGVIEAPIGSGYYAAQLTAPLESGQFNALWDTGAVVSFIVASPAPQDVGEDEPVVLGLARQSSDAYDYSEQSLWPWLVDVAYFLELSHAPTSNDDGTPVFTPERFGPYASRLSQPDREKQRDLDKFTDTYTHHLLVATDQQPTEGDYFAVTCQDASRDIYPVGVEKTYRVLSGIEPRTPAWRDPLLWSVPLAITEEH